MSDYLTLPEAIRHVFTEKEYNAMPDEEKKSLQYDMTHPEVPEDG